MGVIIKSEGLLGGGPVIDVPGVPSIIFAEFSAHPNNA